MQIKEHEELEEAEKAKVSSKMSRNSERIIQEKLEKTIMMQNQEEHEVFDLWPVNMQKNYFENKNNV